MEICIIIVLTLHDKGLQIIYRFGNGLTGAVFKRPILLFLLAELNGCRLYGFILLEEPVKLPSCVRCSSSSDATGDFFPEIAEEMGGSLPFPDPLRCLYCEYDIIDCYCDLLHFIL